MYYSSLLGLVSVTAWLLQTEPKSTKSRSRTFQTALLAASSRGHVSVVSLLLEQGAQVKAMTSDREFSNPLQVASYYGHLPVVRLLVEKGASIETEGEHGRESSALVTAASEGHIAVVDFLLEVGADLHCGSEVNTPLEAASREGHEPIVRLLLKRGAQVYHQSGLDLALQNACFQGDKGVVRLVVRQRSSGERRLETGGLRFRSLLRWSFEAKVILELIEMLLEHGADVNAQSAQIGTPFQLAAEGVDERVINCCWRMAQKSTESRDLTGVLLQVAIGKKRTHQLLELLLEAGADVHAERIRSVRHGSSNCS